MEFAHAAGALGLRAIHGAELSLADGRHLTLLVASDGGGWAKSLPRVDRSPTPLTRNASADADPAGGWSLETLCEHAEGLVCLTGCALHGVHDEPSTAGLREAFGAPGCGSSSSAPWLAGDRAPQRSARRGRTPTRPSAASRPAMSTPTPINVPGCRTRSSRCRHHLTLDLQRDGRRGEPGRTCSPPRRRWQRASAITRRRLPRRRLLAEQLPLRPGRRSRLPLPGGR